MRATLAAGLHARRFHSPPDSAVNPGSRQWLIWRSRTSEDCLHLGGPWPPVTKILKQSLANWLHQRQQRVGSGLGMLDAQGLRAPVDVFQLQTRDLTNTEPIRRQQTQNGIVAQAEWGTVLLCGLQNRRDLIFAQNRGDRLIGIKRRRDDSGGQIHDDVSRPIKVSQERTQSLSDILKRFSPESRRTCFKVSVDVLTAKFLKPRCTATPSAPSAKVASLPQQGINRSVGKPAFFAEPRVVVLTDFPAESLARACRLWLGWPALQGQSQQSVYP